MVVSDPKVLQYEFFLNDLGDKRFVVRAYFSYHVLRGLSWRTQLKLIYRFSGSELLPKSLCEWLRARNTLAITDDELREVLATYLLLYLQQPQNTILPLGFEYEQPRLKQELSLLEHEQPLFRVATKEERYELRKLILEKRTYRMFLCAPNYIMRPAQIFLATIV